MLDNSPKCVIINVNQTSMHMKISTVCRIILSAVLFSSAILPFILTSNVPEAKYAIAWLIVLTLVATLSIIIFGAFRQFDSKTKEI